MVNREGGVPNWGCQRRCTSSITAPPTPAHSRGGRHSRALQIWPHQRNRGNWGNKLRRKLMVSSIIHPKRRILGAVAEQYYLRFALQEREPDREMDHETVFWNLIIKIMAKHNLIRSDEGQRVGLFTFLSVVSGLSFSLRVGTSVLRAWLLLGRVLGKGNSEFRFNKRK